jgi:hypothetical protein
MPLPEKPTINGDNNVWGGKLNIYLDKVTPKNSGTFIKNVNGELVEVAVEAEVAATAAVTQITPTGDGHFVQKEEGDFVSRDFNAAVGQRNPYNNPDVVVARALTNLNRWLDWLDQNGEKGYIGEVGWPYDNDNAKWSIVANTWLDAIASRDRDVWVTCWASGKGWGNQRGPGVAMELSQLYNSTDGGHLDSVSAAYDLVKRHLPEDRLTLGQNLSGFEYGAWAPNSSDNLGYAFIYDQTDFAFLAANGVTLVRLGLSWSRMQQTLNGPLDATAVSQLTSQLDAAHTAGIGVILVPMDGCRYYTGPAGSVVEHVLTIATGDLAQTQFNDFWGKMSDAFKDHPAVIAYDLMNEPHDLAPEAGKTLAQVWETLSQGVVDYLRTSKGDATLLMVEGYQWAGMEYWTANHPDAWIADPANNIRYEAHEYWRAHSTNAYGPSGYWDAMTDAFAEQANASAENVTLSDDQTISGAKTFTGGLTVESDSGNAQLFLNADGDNQQYELYVGNGGNFGIWDDTTNRGIILVAPGSPEGVVYINQYGVQLRARPRVAYLTPVATVYTPDGDTTDLAVITDPSADLTIADPTGTPNDGQQLVIRVRMAATGYALAWGAAYRGSTATPLPTTQPANTTGYYAVQFNNSDGAWDLIASRTGYG